MFGHMVFLFGSDKRLHDAISFLTYSGRGSLVYRIASKVLGGSARQGSVSVALSTTIKGIVYALPIGLQCITTSILSHLVKFS